MRKKWYSYDRIDATGAVYRIVIGKRSNGKTYGAMLKCLKNYVYNNKNFALIRRFKDHMTKKEMNKYFNGLVANNVISKVTKGAWDRVVYQSGEFYLAKWDDELNKVVKDECPFGYTYALNVPEANKGGDVPNVNLIVFDEFLTRSYYLTDEFVIFMNLISTIVRQRDDCTIYMLGNTVNKYCPYFSEMGLINVKNQKQGTIDVYTYGESDLVVAVEYCYEEKDDSSKSSEKYFAFNNPQLKMITDGTWEIALYPHCPYKLVPKDVKISFFIIWEGDIVQGDIIKRGRDMFIFFHMKTTEIKFPESDRIYSIEYSPAPNYFRKITSSSDKIGEVIAMLFRREKIFYQSNEVGEIINNYLKWCRRS